MAFATVPCVKAACKQVVGQARDGRQEAIAEKRPKPALTGRQLPDRDGDIRTYEKIAATVQCVKTLADILNASAPARKRLGLKIDIPKLNRSRPHSVKEPCLLSRDSVIADWAKSIVVDNE